MIVNSLSMLLYFENHHEHASKNNMIEIISTELLIRMYFIIVIQYYEKPVEKEYNLNMSDRFIRNYKERDMCQKIWTKWTRKLEPG